MIASKNRHCVFCGVQLTKTNRSRKHIIPQWLLDYLQIRQEQIQPTHYSVQGEITSTRNHILERLLAGQVCCECNGGWMSDLERIAIPILKPLFKVKLVLLNCLI